MNKQNNINMLHFIGASLVIYGHTFAVIDVPLYHKILPGVTPHGLGLWILFAISGYLVTGSLERCETVGEYIKKRIIRIYPPLILCLLLSVIVLGGLFEDLFSLQYWKSGLVYVWKNILLQDNIYLNSVFADNIIPYSINGSLWSLKIEIACFFLLIPFILLIKKCPRIGKLIFLIFTALLFVTYILKELAIISPDYNTYVFTSLSFFLGSAVYVFELKRLCNLQSAVIVYLLSVGISGIAQVSWIYLPVAVYIALSFAFDTRPLFSTAFKKDICYEMYLYSFPIQQILVQFIIIKKGYQIHVIALFIIALTLTIVVSYFTNRINEIIITAISCRSRVKQDR